jgi:hypothetical protein
MTRTDASPASAGANGENADLVWLGPPLETVGDMRAWSVGYAYTADGYLEDRDIARHFLRERHRIEQAADELNGCFAAVLHTPDGALVVCDRDGSYPLYYSRVGDRLVISNDPWSVLDTIDGPPELDDVAVLDMLRLGYVTGERTLARGVSIVAPSSIWRVRHHRVQAARYWHFKVVPQDAPAEASESQLAAALSGMAVSVAGQLRTSGRSAAMALSGGLDTRLLTALLVREKAEPFRAFSYGAPGDPEMEVGARVAALLGVPHDRVVLQPSYVNDAFIDGAVRAVGFTTRFTCGVGIRHYEGHDVDTFLTGHGGCFSDFNYGLLTAPLYTRDQAREYIYWRNYQLDASDSVPRRVFDTDYSKVKYASIDETLPALDRDADPIGEIYRWGLENRQRKLILMEHRLYEQQGRWVLPIHDHRITAYFMSAPRKMLIGQRAYKDVASQLFRSLSPDLADTPRVGGDMSVDPRFALLVEGSRRMRRIASPLFPLLVRKSKAFAPSPPEPMGADPFRYWFNTDGSARNDILDRVSALDIPIVKNRELRAALLAAQSDKIFTRMLPGALTLQAFSDLLRSKRVAGRAANEAASA